MLLISTPYCAPQTKDLSGGITLREIQPPVRIQGDHPWKAEFVRALAREDLSPLTVQGYAGDVGMFLRWYAPNKLETLSGIDLIHYRQHLAGEKGLRPATLNRRLEAMRRFCRWAHEEKKLKINVATEVKLARTSRGIRPKSLEDPEVQTLLRAAGQSAHGLGKRNYALTQLMLQTGLRVSEAAHLRVSDLVLRERAGSVRIRQGKGRQEREIPLSNSSARRGLRAYLATRSPLDPSDPAFLSEKGAPLSRRSIQRVLSEVARRAKISRLRVSAHTTRHTFALAFLKRHPGKLVELAALLGHESLDTTAIYTQPSQEEMADDLETSGLNADR
jgi:site-specific recombinase XerD